MHNARVYATSHAMQRRDAEDISQEYFGVVNWSGGNVLDVGCGSGEVTAQVVRPRLPKGFSRLIGVDVSAEMVEHAKKTHVYPRLSFGELDIAENTTDILQKLADQLDDKANQRNNNDVADKMSILSLEERNVPKDGFDVVTSFYCLHWVQNQRRALGNINRLLKLNGEGFLVFLARSPIFTLYDKMSTMTEWKPYLKDAHLYIPVYHTSSAPHKQLKHHLSETGFEIISSECREKTFVFSNVSTLQSAIKGVDPFLHKIPAELQNKYMEDCTRLSAELNLTHITSNGCHVSYTLLIAHIRKISVVDSDCFK